jgi:hypothetical protein
LIRFYVLYWFLDPLLGSVFVVEAENVSVTKATIGWNEETRNEYQIVYVENE